MVVQDCRKGPIACGFEEFASKCHVLIAKVDNFWLSEILSCMCSASTQQANHDNDGEHGFHGCCVIVYETANATRQARLEAEVERSVT